ncbi:MAG: primosomal protein N' [Candidatus Izimaplasma sp.]|nr:primosomal protein N' [Candidatus Izimaplasma bacterium]
MYAEIVVDVPAKSVDKTFDYFIPKKFENSIELGARVKVPFGPRTIMGFVLGIKETTEFDLEKIKPIYDLLDVTSTLTPELIQLGLDMRQSNISPLITLFKAMIPSALRSTYQKKITPVHLEQLPLDIAALFNDKKEVILTQKHHGLLNKIKSEINKGTIDLTYIVKQKHAKKYVSILKLNKQKANLRGAKQQLLFDYLKHHKSGKKTTIKETLNLSYSTINSLIDKRIITEESLEEYRKIETRYKPNKKQITLNPKQEEVYNKIKQDNQFFSTYLLHGVTGSGKTEIYLNVIEDALNNNKEAIMLVPEISLTPMMVSRFRGRFGNQVAVFHSHLSIGEKYDEWRKIKRQEVSVVVGARSAIFAPFENLGVIIIDEEHTSTYKQETTPRYHALDVAKKRAKMNDIPLILGSATPSVDSYYKALHGEFRLLELPERANLTTLPKVYVEDMAEEFKTGNLSIFSQKLKSLIKDRLRKKEQIILLLNRRGHSSFVICRNCGEVIMCPNCDISLTYHDKSKTLKCHYCNHQEKTPKNCPNCDSKYIRYMGIGTEKVEEIIKETYPKAAVFRMDRDTTTKKNAHEEILYEFEHTGDILIGTQMIAKGLDFPKVTLVGVLVADMSLNLPDYKAIESTFQLLTQVAGRSGRHEIDGEVVIQSYNPDHYAIKYAKTHDYISFYQQEISIRKLSGYTPIYKMIQIILSDKDVGKTLKIGTKITLKLRHHLSGEAKVLGPVLPKVARIKNFYRAQIIIKYKEEPMIHSLLQDVYDTFKDTIIIAVDHNPNLL